MGGADTGTVVGVGVGAVLVCAGRSEFHGRVVEDLMAGWTSAGASTSTGVAGVALTARNDAMLNAALSDVSARMRVIARLYRRGTGRGVMVVTRTSPRFRGTGPVRG